MSCATVVAVFILIYFGSTSGNDDLRRIDGIQPESSCLAAGGMCTIAADCPQGQLAKQSGLCPKQSDQGVECCYGISVKETRCRKRGGVCVPLAQNCNPRLVVKYATDCLDKELCCIMV